MNILSLKLRGIPSEPPVIGVQDAGRRSVIQKLKDMIREHERGFDNEALHLRMELPSGVPVYKSNKREIL